MVADELGHGQDKGSVLLKIELMQNKGEKEIDMLCDVWYI